MSRVAFGERGPTNPGIQRVNGSRGLPEGCAIRRPPSEIGMRRPGAAWIRSPKAGKYRLVQETQAGPRGARDARRRGSRFEAVPRAGVEASTAPRKPGRSMSGSPPESRRPTTGPTSSFSRAGRATEKAVAEAIAKAGARVLPRSQLERSRDRSYDLKVLHVR